MKLLKPKIIRTNYLTNLYFVIHILCLGRSESSLHGRVRNAVRFRHRREEGDADADEGGGGVPEVKALIFP